MRVEFYSNMCPCLYTTLWPFLSPSAGNPAGDGYSRARVSESAAVFGLWEAHTESSHQRAKVQGDWKWPCVYSQWSVYFQTAQSQNTDRWAKFVYITVENGSLTYGPVFVNMKLNTVDLFLYDKLFITTVLLLKFGHPVTFNKHEHTIILLVLNNSYLTSFTVLITHLVQNINNTSILYLSQMWIN